MAHFGLEHHESDDSRIGERSLLTPLGRRSMGGLLSHEFVHSSNGKFRRPAGLSTPDFETPIKTDLLWVYEGLTDYLGNLLAARSGSSTAEQYREYLAANVIRTSCVKRASRITLMSWPSRCRPTDSGASDRQGPDTVTHSARNPRLSSRRQGRGDYFPWW